MFDEALINVRSGKGGDGAIHFHREKYVSRGGPDGGDGGRGGDVILEVLPTLNTLSAFHHQSRYYAQEGKAGGPNNMSGRSAPDMIVHVPPGTVVYNAANGEVLGDLVAPGQKLIVARGGRGGKGNQHYATSRHQVPRMAEKGVPFEEFSLRLELKLIADVGIVGVPNAGKSSFLAAVTNARPKIAPYPFTTLEPNLGVVEFDISTTLVLADIPGLIEGAHAGAGLGDAFLRHVQRTRVLIHLIDGLSTDPMADFSQINSEMALFDSKLAEKPQLVVLNKIDLPEVQAVWPDLKKKLAKRGYQAMTISALARTDLQPVLKKVLEMVQNAPEPEVIVALPVYRPADDPRAFTIERSDDGWKVKGTALERAAKMTYWDEDESVRRFQKLMETIGVEDALRKAGAEEGDIVFISDYELEWQD